MTWRAGSWAWLVISRVGWPQRESIWSGANTRLPPPLLTAARDAARINGRPVLQLMVDTWIARLATAQGDRARSGVRGPGTPGPQARDDWGRAQLPPEESRVALP